MTRAEGYLRRSERPTSVIGLPARRPALVDLLELECSGIGECDDCHADYVPLYAVGEPSEGLWAVCRSCIR